MKPQSRSATRPLWIRNGLIVDGTYHRMIVAGEITIRDDEATGARPGRLARGAR